MFRKKKFIMAGLILTASLVLSACGGGSTESSTDEGGSKSENSEEIYNWNFVTEEMEGQVQFEYAREFADLLAEKSDGRINMEIYEFGGLGSEVDQVEQMQDGIVEFAIMSPGFTGTMVTEGQLFALQFLFTDDMALNQEILNTSEALNVHLSKKYEEHNIKPLAYFTEGAMQWTSNKPLQSPEDFQNFKMRTQESPLIMESYKAYGADPTAMSWSELYTSLDRNIVDGQENPIFFIEDASFNEVQDYMTISNHNIYVAMLTVNPNFYDSLPDDIKKMIDETVEEMRPIAYDLQDKLNREMLESIRENETHSTEIIELSEAERDAFRQLALPVREYFINEVVGEDGKELLDMLQKEIEEVEE
ncbi:C4-dicarboxylate ABC transporter [Halalkalibacter okhensis]|uniref:C4-dicarboxylate ABC transporter n=1 Tax=Halalkalibacter okhensis TaxID=333138 RepID=A0A0B0IB17_9BACI|nr:DctP family TRAP transporter solute-binding subunit [Halalkalibacter okhensis]KHF38475.1 C4-dicarboxylate ABC transporter [Halalkalibacter okhensis]